MVRFGDASRLARLFRVQGRERILKVLQEVSNPIAEAKAKIKNMGRTPEDLVPMLSLPPGQAHRTAADTYQKRNIDESVRSAPCRSQRSSVRYCVKHLAACRDRARVRAKKVNKSPHGRAPGTLAALAEGRKKPKGKYRSVKRRSDSYQFGFSGRFSSGLDSFGGG